MGDEFAFVPAERLIAAVQAIVIVQRDYGDRTNRRHARLKYTIDDRGLDWFRAAVEAQAGFALEPWRPLPAWTVPAYRAGPSRATASGSTRSRSSAAASPIASTVKLKTALREIVAQTGRNFVATPDQSLLIVDVDDAQRATIDAILAANGVATMPTSSSARRWRARHFRPAGWRWPKRNASCRHCSSDVREAWYAAGLRRGRADDSHDRLPEQLRASRRPARSASSA